MKKIKSLIARTIKNLGKLTAFALLVIPSFAICCLLGSWTTDQNGNIVGSNLLESYNASGDMYNATLRLNASFNANTTYTLSFPNDIESNLTSTNISNIANSGWRHRTYVTFTIDTSNHTYVNLVFQGGSSGNNLIQKVQNQTYYMLNQGTEIEEYEPYGVFYSQNNYDLYGTTRYNEGYAEGYTDGYNQATEDVINQYAIPIVEAQQIQQVVMNALNANDEDAGRISFSMNENTSTNTLELTNINTIAGTTKNVINIYLINNLQLTEFKASEGFYAVLLGNQRLSASYDGTNYIINEDTLKQTQVVNIIKIEIATNVRAINIKMKGSNLSIDGTKNAYESGKEIGKQQQADEDQATISQLQTQYDTLLDHYNNAQLDNPLSKMIIAVADIPLNLFHSMFNFDIMGFNLAAFILGIITILLVAYVIKLFL